MELQKCEVCREKFGMTPYPEIMVCRKCIDDGYFYDSKKKKIKKRKQPLKAIFRKLADFFDFLAD